MARIFYVAGHGNGDPGAVGNGHREADMVRKLGARLKELGGDNVIIGDPSINWYASGKFNSAAIPGDCIVIEGHMDAGVPTARGGHVIIQDGLEADQYDAAIAELMGKIFPGRSQLLVPRDNLANPDICSRRGINYRLVEFGFVTNAEDCQIFLSRMDAVCRGLLAAAGIQGTTEAGGENVNYLIINGVNVTHHKGQYLFDGHSIRGFGDPAERDATVQLLKDAGITVKYKAYPAAQWDALIKCYMRGN